jgi:hypothetical protein
MQAGRLPYIFLQFTQDCYTVLPGWSVISMKTGIYVRKLAFVWSPTSVEMT